MDVIGGMENQAEHKPDDAALPPAKQGRDLPDVAYPLNRMVSLYYESGVSDGPWTDTDPAEPHLTKTQS